MRTPTAASIIRQLPPAVADAIAAGEVVEHPAAAIKELIENAIDSGARRIDVEIEGGGLTRIVVADDGCGIAADQLPLAMARHATSKISGVDDLAAIRSLGFRGEALASIAAVSDLRLRSRPADAATGSEIHLRGAELLDRGPAAMALGTVVEVCDLFVVTPARLAFLRQPRAEAAAAIRVVADAALARPGIAFTCRNDGRTVLRSPGGTLDDAVRAVIGERHAAELLPVSGDGDIPVDGRISQPRSHRADRNQLVLLVNGRRVHNRALVVAVEEAYTGLLPVGRHPYGVLDISCDPASVDVNVHPTKREVRFREQRRVFSAVQRACWAALADAGLHGTGALLGSPPAAGSAEPMLVLGEPVSPWGAPREMDPRGAQAWASGAETGGNRPASAGGAVPPDPVVAAADATLRLADLAPLRPIGHAGGGWLIADSPRGLVIVDPHAAHEKLLYIELIESACAAEAGERLAASQLLLIDCVVDVDSAAAAMLDDPELRGLGFDVESFGPGLARVRAVPAAAATVDPSRLVSDVLTALIDPAGDRRHRLAALTACHAAVRLGDRLAPAEQVRLLERLPAATGGLTCPHGRPTVMVLDDPALRRAFRRPAV